MRDARYAFWKIALGNNTRLASLAKAALSEMETELAAAQEHVNRLENTSINMLCSIHRDGGHYIDKHGYVKAYDDAMDLVHQWKLLPDELAEGTKKGEGNCKHGYINVSLCPNCVIATHKTQVAAQERVKELEFAHNVTRESLDRAEADWAVDSENCHAKYRSLLGELSTTQDMFDSWKVKTRELERSLKLADEAYAALKAQMAEQEPVGEVQWDAKGFMRAKLFVTLDEGTKLYLHPAPIPEGMVLVPKADLEHWLEYWNGDDNPTAMRDALNFIECRIQDVLAAAGTKGER